MIILPVDHGFEHGPALGSITGRNLFQRNQAAAFRRLDEMVRIYQE